MKKFPVRPHIVHMTRLWQCNPSLVVVKSRQMIMTWLYCALALWDCLFNDGRLVMLQGKKLEDAVGDENSGDGLLGRAKFVLHHIPALSFLLPWYDRKRDCTEARIRFRGRYSTLQAIPEGGNIIRTHTVSGLLTDEAAVQPEFAEAYTASVPCLRGGGWVVALSTPNPGFFRLLYEDRVHEQ